MTPKQLFINCPQMGCGGEGALMVLLPEAGEGMFPWPGETSSI